MSDDTADTVYRRAQAVAAGLLAHHRANDPDGMAELLGQTVPDSDDPEIVESAQRAVVLALTELAQDALDEKPDDPDAWLAERLRGFRDRSDEG
jgi:hypothetical protein